MQTDEFDHDESWHVSPSVLVGETRLKNASLYFGEAPPTLASAPAFFIHKDKVEKYGLYRYDCR